MAILITLGGVPLVWHAGAPELEDDVLDASTLLRMSDGRGVNMHRYQKATGSIAGQGLMPPGLDGLDFTRPLELRTTQVSNVVGEGRIYTPKSTPRPDVPPWAFALLDGQWIKTPCTFSAGVITIAERPGAELYQACWMPVYSVFAKRPPKSQSTVHSWSIPWEES